MAKTSVRLDSGFISLAQQRAKIDKRSIPNQIEYWVGIGRQIEENPVTTFNILKRRGGIGENGR